MGCADMRDASIQSRAGNHEGAVKQWRTLAALGIPGAQVSLGRAYLKGEGIEKNPRKAYELFRQAEKKDSRVAIFEIARLFEKGIVVPQNTAQALAYYERSGELDYARGYYYAGKIYERGRLVDKDISKAIENYKKAVALGYDRATQDIEKLES